MVQILSHRSASSYNSESQLSLGAIRTSYNACSKRTIFVSFLLAGCFDQTCPASLKLEEEARGADEGPLIGIFPAIVKGSPLGIRDATGFLVRNKKWHLPMVGRGRCDWLAHRLSCLRVSSDDF